MNGDGTMDREEMHTLLKMILINGSLQQHFVLTASGSKMMDMMMGAVKDGVKEVRQEEGIGSNRDTHSGMFCLPPFLTYRIGLGI